MVATLPAAPGRFSMRNGWQAALLERLDQLRQMESLPRIDGGDSATTFAGPPPDLLSARAQPDQRASRREVSRSSDVRPF
jgi:hypothetical protein